MDELAERLELTELEDGVVDVVDSVALVAVDVVGDGVKVLDDVTDGELEVKIVDDVIVEEAVVDVV